MNKKEQLDKNGWLIVKDVFTPAEIESLRKAALSTKSHRGDVLSNEKLQEVLADERIINILKEALGTEELLYFGDSSVSIDRTGNGFHKDSRDRHDKNSPDWSDPNYSLLRFGIYLQDHANHSGGLCLRDKSHFEHSIAKGKMINVKTEIGDVIVWKLTTTHSANADVVKFLPNTALHPRLARKFPKFLLQDTIRPRIAIFACFGLNDDYADKYIEYLKTRKYAIERWQISNYSPSIVKELKAKGVQVVQDFALEDVSLEKANEHFKQV